MMKLLVCFLVLINVVFSSGNDNYRTIPKMPVPELINYWGYPVEEHWVTTEDGYILGLHRIPRGNNQEGDKEGPKAVVYMQHGITTSSSCWVFGPPKKSLGFMLADAGYDVWMGNNRGNTYSRNHTTLEVCNSCKEFWDFDWHESGLYDIPASIDYVLNVTEETEVNFICHSMGCSEYLVTMSMRTEYNEKIRMGVMLAPTAYMSHASNPLFLFSEWMDELEYLYHLFGFYEFLPSMEIINQMGHLFCSDEHPQYQDLCMNLGFLLLGFNENQLNGTMLPVYMDHIPEGTTTRQWVHFAQLYLSGNFEAYDFGAEENLLRYNQPLPPKYDMSQVTAPTAIIKGDRDDLVDLDDVTKLVNDLPNVVSDHLVELEDWSHLCFIIAMDAYKYVYSYVLNILER